MADESPPIRGDFSDAEAAADALLKKAQGAKPEIEGAKRTVKRATAETRGASSSVDDLQAEVSRLQQARRELANKRTRALSNLRKADQRLASAGDSPGKTPQAAESAQRRMRDTYDKNDRLYNQLAQQVDDIDRKIAEAQSRAKAAAQAAPKPAPARRARQYQQPIGPARPTQTLVTQSYIDARQRAEAITYARREPQRYDDPTVVARQRQRLIEQYQLTESDLTAKGQAAANESASQVRAAAARYGGVQGQLPGVGQAGRIPRATKPQLGTQAFRNALEKLKQVPTAQVEINDYFARAMDSGAKGARQVTDAIEDERRLAAATAQVERNKASRAKRKPKAKPQATPPAAIAADPNQYARPIGPENLRPVTARAKAPAAPTGDIAKKVGDLEAFERKLDDHVDKLAAALDPDQRAEFQRRQQPTPDAERPAARERVAAAREKAADDRAEQARQAASDERIRASREGLIRHPELFGARQPGPFGRVYASDTDEAGAPRGARSPLQDLNARLRAAQDAQDESATALRTANKNRKNLSDDELVAAEAKHRENQALVDTLRKERRAVLKDVDATIAGTRARNAETEAMVAAARARGPQGVPAGRQLVPYAQPGSAVVPTGVSRDPYSQLSAAERVRLSQPGRPGTALVRTGISRDDYSQLNAGERALLASVKERQRVEEEIAASRRGEAKYQQYDYTDPSKARFQAEMEARRIRAESGNRRTGPASDADLRAVEALRERQESNAAWSAGTGQRIDANTQALNRWTSQMGYANQAMRRHGTFTTEFITAAQRGEVSYREWGWQIGAAAAKFGAWTAAGAGIYAALGAVGKIGEGAVQSASGVDSLKRTIDNVNATTAQQGFRDMAAKFNVPIETVVDAQTKLGAVFHDQGDAAKATEAALYALQTGQVDIATSTKDLIAIQQAYGSSAEDLVTLFDELNFVQNEYSARIGDIETGIASASGSFKQLGGSMEEAVALFTTLQRFGTSGNITSTIVRRLPNTLNKPRNKEYLSALGIDPTQDVIPLLRQAAQVAQRPGVDAQQLAAHITTPEYAGRLLNLLNNFALYEQVLRRLQAGEAIGASERELGHVLDQFDQRLKAIGTELSNLGSNLASSGLLTVIGTGVVALKEFLSLTNTILGVFNQIPGPIKTAVSAIALMRVGLAGARRLGLGDAVAGRFGGLGDRAAPYLMENETRRARRAGRKGINDAVKAATDENERATSDALRAVNAEQVAIKDTQRVAREAGAKRAAGEITDVEESNLIARAQQRELRAIETRETAELRAAVAADNLTGQTKIRDRVQQESRNIPWWQRGARSRRDQAYVRGATDAGVHVPPSLRMDVPGAERVERLEDIANARSRAERAEQARSVAQRGESVTAGGLILPGGTRRPAAAGALADAADDIDDVIARSRETAVGSARFRDRLREMGSSIGRSAGVYRDLAKKHGIVLTSAAAGINATRGAASAGRAAGAAIGRFATSAAAFIGPEGLIIGALLALPQVYEAVKNRYESLDKATKLQGAGGDISEVDALKRQILARQKEADSFIGTIQRMFTDPLVLAYRAAKAVGEGVGSALDAAGGAVRGVFGAEPTAKPPKRPGVQPPKRGEGLLGTISAATAGVPGLNFLANVSGEVEYRARQKEYEAILARSRKARQLEATRKAGGANAPSTGITGNDVGFLADADVREFQRGRIDRAEFEKRRDARLAEVQALLASGKIDKNRGAYLTRRLKELFDQSDAAVQASVDEIEGRYNLLQSQTNDPVREAELKVQEAAEKLAIANKSGDQNDINNALAEYNEAQKGVPEALRERAEKQIDALGAIVNAGLGGNAAIGSYVNRLRTEIAKVAGSGDPEDMQRYAQLQGQLRDAMANAGKQQLEDALALARTPEEIDQAYRDYARAGRAATRPQQQTQQQGLDIGTMRSGLGHGTGGMGSSSATESASNERSDVARAILRQRQQEIFEAFRARAEAASSYAQSNLGGGLASAKAALATASDLLRRGIKVYAKGSVELLGLMQNQQQAANSVVQEQLSLIQARGQLAVAGITDPVAQGQGNIANLEEQLAFMRARPKQFGKEGESVQIAQTLAQIKDAKAALAEQIRQQAQDLIDAQYALRASLTDDPVEQARLEAERTAAIVARGGFKSAADKLRAKADANNAKRAAAEAALQAKLDDIDFDKELGRITTEEQIRKYEELLKTSKVGTQRKKELKQQIERLKHEAETADESSFELGLDKIRVPTMYEVARLVKGGAGGVTAPVTNANQVNVYVNGQADYEQLGRVLEKHITGAGKATARAAQMR